MVNLFASLSASPFLVIPLLVWSMVWKGLALWKAAKKDSKIWFWVILLVNTMGLLEIAYIYFFSERETKKKTHQALNKSK